MAFVPDRGDLVWLTGRRPALVLSPKAYNGKVGLAIACPITSHVKGYPFEVVLPAGLSVSGAVLSDQLKSLDWSERKAALIARVPEEITAEVIGKVSALLVPMRVNA